MEAHFFEDQCYVSYLSSIRISSSLLSHCCQMKMFGEYTTLNFLKQAQCVQSSSGQSRSRVHRSTPTSMLFGVGPWLSPVSIKVMFDAQTWPQNRAKGDWVRITFSDRLFLRALETHWVTTAKSCASVWIKNDFWRVWDDVSCLTHKQHENFTHWLLVSKTNNCCILYTSEELFLMLSCYSFKSYGNLWNFDILDWIIVCAL